MTPDRITELKAKAKSWSDSNPFKSKLLARLGGLHQSPSTDREPGRVEAKITHLRETAEAMSTEACEF